MIKTFLHIHSDNLIAFIGGDIAVTLYVIQHTALMDFGIKVFTVAVCGFWGGFAGLSGKWFWKWIEKRYLK